ncbi:MAG: phosphoribosylanthranilate isomerase [Pseudomonadota bacterium]
MRVKICGLKTPELVDAAVAAGADYLGFVFFEKSPRNISFDQAADLVGRVPAGVCKTALVVDPSDAMLDDMSKTVAIDMIQLHGSETPARVSEIKSRLGLPVMKAVGIADAHDLPKISDYSAVADQLLIDAKPPKDGELPGGNGLTFDWRLLSGRRWAVPWMLAGGLTPTNVGEAAKLTGAVQVDVSSGVETAPGEKSAELIEAFLQASKAEHVSSES